MSSTSRSNNKKNDVFTKKVPTNPKYQNVKSKLDTGASASNYLNKIEEIRKNYRYKKDEIFKRMKVSTFAQLVLQVAEVVNIELDRLELETARSAIAPEEPEEEAKNENLPEKGECLSERHLLQDVVRGVGEFGLDNNNDNSGGTEQGDSNNDEKSATMPDLTSLPYLLLDIRDKDAYDECHIIGSLNYPAAMLSRSVNYLSPEMLLFKNKPGKIIILYDADEKMCPNVATVLVQREIDNVMMLSGGLKVLNKKFPGCFVSGKLPASCFSPVLDRKGKPKALTNKVENEGVKWFSSELLMSMQDKLDEVLLSNDSSRLSSRTTTRSSKAPSAMPTGRSSTQQKTWR